VLTEPIVITILLLLLLLYNIENTTHAGCITILNISILINALSAGHENIRAGFKCPQCYAKVNTMR
jgi:hypothetical protein